VGIFQKSSSLSQVGASEKLRGLHSARFPKYSLLQNEKHIPASPSSFNLDNLRSRKTLLKLNANLEVARRLDRRSLRLAVRSCRPAVEEVGIADHRSRLYCHLGVRRRTIFKLAYVLFLRFHFANLVVLVVVVVAGPAMVALRRTPVASLLPISAWGTATIALAALSTESSLRAISRVLLLRRAMLRLAVASLALMWWTTATVLARRRRGVAVVT
jgi:hypothetical protein